MTRFYNPVNTPSKSVRTVKPATAVANHMKLRRRENAGRNSQIAFHQGIHSDIVPSCSLLSIEYSMCMLYP